MVTVVLVAFIRYTLLHTKLYYLLEQKFYYLLETKICFVEKNFFSSISSQIYLLYTKISKNDSRESFIKKLLDSKLYAL